MAPRKPVPKKLPHTAPYWDAAAEGKLVVQRCSSCDEFWFYPRLVCPGCMGIEFVWDDASGRATLYSYIRIARPVPGWEGEAGYVVAMVELAEGPRMMTNILTDQPELLELDMPLRVVFEDRDGTKIPQFAPEETADVQA